MNNDKRNAKIKGVSNIRYLKSSNDNENRVVQFFPLKIKHVEELEHAA